MLYLFTIPHNTYCHLIAHMLKYITITAMNTCEYSKYLCRNPF